MTFHRMSAAALIATVAMTMTGFTGNTHAAEPAFRVLLVTSSGPEVDHDHDPMIVKAKPLFEKLAVENNFALDFSRDSGVLTEKNLANYQALVQMHLVPFNLTQDQQQAIQRFIERGGGWVGIHTTGITGKLYMDPNAPYWDWFQKAMGDVVYSPHPAIQTATIKIEDRTHPVTKNLPVTFRLKDEWYEFDKSPRPNVHVLAVVDESTYTQNKPMGDHPIIWINENYDRMIYIGIGHDVTQVDDPNFQILMRDAILWAGTR